MSEDFSEREIRAAVAGCKDLQPALDTAEIAVKLETNTTDGWKCPNINCKVLILRRRRRGLAAGIKPDGLKLENYKECPNLKELLG